MLTDLKNEIRAALAETSSQQTVDTDVLAKGHHRSRVEAALMELYQAQEVCCCKITKRKSKIIKRDIERVVWWETRFIEPFKSPWQLNQEKLKRNTSKAEGG